MAESNLEKVVHGNKLTRRTILEDIVLYMITKSMRALCLVNQLWVIVPVNSRKNRASSEFLYIAINFYI